MPRKPAANACPPKDLAASPVESPARLVRLPRFIIARYPVTVAQWRAYHRATGAPVDERSLEGEANHPVVYVSWRDAVGYCAWLTDALRRRARAEAARPAGSWRAVPEALATLLLKGDGGSGPWVVTLPSEAEWERTARGTPGRRYPCGAAIDQDRANYWGERDEDEHKDEYRIGGTSAVGCFRGGATPDGGVEELAGNVWEWTRSAWLPYGETGYEPLSARESVEVASDARRVLRGGSFLNVGGNVRSAFRFFDGTDNRHIDIGFRVMVAPFSSDL